MRIDFQNAILLVLCLVLLLSVFTISSNAAGTNFVLSTSAFDPSFLYSVSGTNTFAYNQSEAPVYAGYCTTRPDRIYLVSTVPATVTLSSSGQDPFPPVDLTVQYENSGLYYCSVLPGGSNYTLIPNSAFPVYNTPQDFVDDVNSLLNPTSSLQYTLPPGNVAYIPIPSGQSSAISYTLTTTYYMAFGNNDTSRINQVVTVMSSLPSSSNNVAPSTPKIPWTNNGNVNLLGVSANKIYQGSIPSNYGGQYLVIVNPMTMPSQSGLIGGDTYTNGSINISVSAVSGSPHIYPMSESLTITPGDGIGSESSYGDSGFTYEIDSETGEIIWTDPEGGSSAPVAGGNNPMPSPNTIFDWLRNISQQFSDFLRGPVQAVQVVVSAIRDFMGSFTQLYQWLPSPVYSLITSALMIALTIGVIKIFV